jgi:hypothetical protein
MLSPYINNGLNHLCRTSRQGNPYGVVLKIGFVFFKCKLTFEVVYAQSVKQLLSVRKKNQSRWLGL